MRSRPVRPRTGGIRKSLSIEDSTAKNGERLEQIQDNLGHLQTVLQNIQENEAADKPSGDQGQHNDAACARGGMSNEVWLKERITT